MVEIRYAEPEDKQLWRSMDVHLPESEFENKVRDRQLYILLENSRPVGVLRYSLFWDSIPFCNLIFIASGYRRMGFGRLLAEHWAADMKERYGGALMTSTRADETAQHFYRALGYRDCGGFIIDIPEYAQPTELLFIKANRKNT